MDVDVMTRVNRTKTATATLPWLMYPWLAELQHLGVLRAMDVEFAQFFAQKQPTQLQEAACLVASLLSAHVGRKHLCLALDSVKATDPFSLGVMATELRLPTVVIDDALLTQFNHVAHVQGRELPPEHALLVVQRGKLYLARYWHYEHALACALLQRQQQHTALDLNTAKTWLDKLFVDHASTIDWQKMACAVASVNQFSVITGGPGTGKTTTVTRLLLLLNAVAETNLPVVRLVAPTGKAAMRLSESIKDAKVKLAGQLKANEDVATQHLITHIVDDASTIHRLLGVIPHSATFRFNQERRLPLDVLIVDEASMVDLPLMAKLVSALPDHAKLILLGDKDQLASVEAGSVMGDICDLPNLVSGDYECGSQQFGVLQHLVNYPLVSSSAPKLFSDSVIALRVSHRFDAKSGIGKLAKAVNNGDTREIQAIVAATISGPEAHSAFPDVVFHSHTANDIAALVQSAAQRYRKTFQMIRQCQDTVHEHVVDVLESFNRFRVLCALRRSEYGVEQLNQSIEQALYRQGMVQLTDQSGRWYVGKPIMISANDYQLSLFNGDIGILLPDAEGRLKAWFIQPDGTVLSVFPNRLPAHETVYAMTIHKSQGSEFDEVAILLPDHKYIGAQSIVTRELVYTGITRAKSALHLYAEPSILLRSAQITTQRASGLAERLYSTV